MDCPIRLTEHSVEFNNCGPSASAEDRFWDFDRFEQNLSIKIIEQSKDENDLEFDIIGIKPQLVNAIRRVLLAEVPSMAVDRVHIYNNTSIIQDEVLAHRIGMIPFKTDPRKFKFKTLAPFPSPENGGLGSNEDDTWNEDDSLQFRLKVKCSFAPGGNRNADGGGVYINDSVKSSSITWEPIGDQAKEFTRDQVGPVHDDILIAKLRPGHEIDLRMYAVKGISKDHAKFQPVSTATYRLLPDIRLLEEIEGERAQRLKNCFSEGVIQLETDEKTKKVVAKVANPRLDYCSRNVFRHNDLKDCVQLGRVPDHYIFTIESVGALPARELFLEAIKVLKEKCNRLLEQHDEEISKSAQSSDVKDKRKSK